MQLGRWGVKGFSPMKTNSCCVGADGSQAFSSYNLYSTPGCLVGSQALQRWLWNYQGPSEEFGWHNHQCIKVHWPNPLLSVQFWLFLPLKKLIIFMKQTHFLFFSPQMDLSTSFFKKWLISEILKKEEWPKTKFRCGICPWLVFFNFDFDKNWIKLLCEERLYQKVVQMIAGVLTGIVLNLCINLRRSDILTILSLSTQEPGIFLL